MRVPLLLLCALVAGCGSTPAASLGEEGPPPERSTREGQPVQLDGAGGIAALSQSADDPAVLVAQSFDRRRGLPPECRRYTEVRVLAQDDGRVQLAAYQYRPTWEVEPECPLVEGDPTTQRIRLRAPLGDRDVRDFPDGPPLFVQDRVTPGRTPVRGGPSCADTSETRPNPGADYRHFLRHDGRMYDAVLPNAGAAFVGPPLGRVRCTLSGSLTPFRYESRDGDAGFVGAGTPYYAVEGRPVEEAVGAVWDGKPTLFEHRPD
jgi:hypothetical protein